MTENENSTILPNTAGIYLFTNNVNSKHYVGQSIDIKNRFYDHMTRMKRLFNYPLYNALNKYGLESFNWEVIETVDRNNFSDIKELVKTLDALEIKWIEHYDSYNNGYNLTKGGHSIVGYVQTEESRKKISESIRKTVLNGKYKIYIYNVIREEYSEWLTLKEFNEITGNSNRRLTGNDFVLVDHQWVGAKTKELLQEKIAFWENYRNENFTFRGKFQYKVDLDDPEVIEDLNELPWQEFSEKYTVTKSTYYNYRKKVHIPTATESGKNPRRKGYPDEFINDYNVLTREQIIEKYKISQRTYYTWRNQYITKKIIK